MIETANIKAILTDIEGTTSSLSFVKDVLFPYARARIPAYVRAHEAELGDILNEVRKTEGANLSAAEIIPLFLRWMDEDKKITPLKTLQGLIWREGYENGELKGHIYEDAARGLKYWRKSGLKLYVYSSGSIAAQKLLFGYSESGDLTSLFSGYFDTGTGPKIEAASYKKIAAEIRVAPEFILFLSDSAAELDAAKIAGMQTILLARDGAAPNTEHTSASSFNDITIQDMAA